MSQKSNSTLTQLSDDSTNNGRVLIKIPAASTQTAEDASPDDGAPATTTTSSIPDPSLPSPPIPTAPAPTLISTTGRRMTRQSERTAHSLSGTAAVDAGSDPTMDESLRSFFLEDTSTATPSKDDPNASAKGKGKGKAMGGEKEKTTASGSGLTRSPSKSESAAAGVRRVESRVSSLADIVHTNTDDMAQLRSQILSIAEDVRAGMEGRSVDLADDPSFRELAHANNRTVTAVDSINSNMHRVERSLRALEDRITALEPHMENIYSAIERLTQLSEHADHGSRHSRRSNSPEYNHRPSQTNPTRRTNEERDGRHQERSGAKRRRTSSGSRFPDGYDEEWYNISGTVAQPPFRGSIGSMAQGPIYQPSAPNDSVAAMPRAPPLGGARTPMAPPASAPAVPITPSAPAVPHAPNTSKDRVGVIVGKVTWGKNTTGGFKAIMDMMPALNRIPRAGIRAIRIQGHVEYVRVNFGSDADAAYFAQIWTAGPRPTGYENVTAVLEN